MTEHAPAPFIVGVGRSGTTLLRLMIDAHSEIAIPGETHFLPAVLDLPRSASPADVSRVITSSSTWPNMALDATALDDALEACQPFSIAAALRAFYELYAARFGKPRWGDKTPPYRTQMMRIAEVLPEARFVHLIRDGRDAALSYRGLWFGPGDDIEAQARFWMGEILSAQRQARELKHYMEVRYEDLVRRPDETLRAICGFLGLAYDPRMLAYHATASMRLAEYKAAYGPAGRTPSDVAPFIAIHERTHQAPDPDRVGRWRTEMPELQQKQYEDIAGGLLRSLGYETRWRD